MRGPKPDGGMIYKSYIDISLSRDQPLALNKK